MQLPINEDIERMPTLISHGFGRANSRALIVIIYA